MNFMCQLQADSPLCAIMLVVLFTKLCTSSDFRGFGNDLLVEPSPRVASSLALKPTSI
jgi:hypothetical protein